MPAMDYALVAKWYDSYAISEMDVPFFVEACRGKTSILELTSGTGRLSIPLLKAGISLTCLDSSAEMLAVFKDKLEYERLNAVLYEMDICHLDLPDTYDLIFIPFNSFAEITAAAAQRQTLNGIYRHLRPAGSFICTLHNPAVRRKNMDGKRYERGRFKLPGSQQVLALASLENYDETLACVNGVQFYDIYDAHNNLIMQREVPLQFCLHSRETFESMVQAAGFEVSALYGNYDRTAYEVSSSPFMIWVLTKV
ncbi:MAG: class I SAM-dependent methyltransferase [Anaerolineae bacterium]|nr:class I SAM-dependent methyltransferase [Anaerolineae bacterium]